MLNSNVWKCFRRTVRACAALALVAAFSSTIAAQTHGAIAGRVVDANTRAPLAGANVALEGTVLVTAVDASGAFRLPSVPAGKYTLVVTYLGHAQQKTEVTVAARQTASVEVALSPAAFTETVTVRAEPIGEGQALALNQQRTARNITNVISADQIGSFPDPNAAEAASRIPGVSIARDQGEGRYVLVRGTEARLNSMMIDGERIPAPEGDARQVALDAVPADQLQSIQVSKALTADMDADSIGGAVNLITRQAVGRPTMLFNLAGGFNALQDSADQRQFGATLGRRVNGGRVGLLAGFSGSQLTRGSENFEAEYTGAGGLGDLQLRDYMVDRHRYGGNAAVDVRASDTSSFTFRGILNRFEDYEVNNRIRFRPGNRRIEHVLKNRNQNQNIRSFSGLGQHLLGASGVSLDYRLAYAFAEEDQPDRLDTIFRQSGINFSPNVSASSIDPENIQPNPSANNAANATLNAWETEIFNTQDRDYTGSFNVRMPLATGSGRATMLQFGAKVRDKNKERSFLLETASPASTVRFPELQDTGFDNSGFLSYFPAGYAPFPGINANASRAMFNALPASRKSIDHEGDASAYDAKERVLAGYAMAEIYLSDRLLLLPGVRVESTDVDYTGFDVQYDEDGDYESTRPVTGGDRYTQLLPGMHLKFAATPSVNVRAAYTRSLARPNYYDLVPYQLVFREDGEIARGNSALKPTTSDNLDFMVENYFRSVGVVSAGVFFKRMGDYIYPFRFTETNFGDVYEVTQPRNGESATLWGAEIAFQNQFRQLPAPFDGLGVYANYTWTDSSATFPDRAGDATLPGQSSSLGNFAVWYEKYGFSAKASWNFKGKYIDAVGGAAAEDVYYDDHLQFDVNASYRVTRNVRLFADFMNLGNEPLRYYIGTTNRPIQQEYYRWWSAFGVKFNF